MNTDNIDPYANSAFSLSNRFARFLWWVVWFFLFRPSPRPFFAWRRNLLRLFGSEIGKGVAIYSGVTIWAPWNLICEDMVAIANGVNIYNPSIVKLCSHAIVSQDAYLCGASHDYNHSDFPLYSKPIEVGPYAWICAKACVLPGIKIGERAVLGLASVATCDLDPYSVYAGSPAKFIKMRVIS